MRLKALEDAVNILLDRDLKLRLYGSREGTMVVDIYIHGSRLWRGEFVNSIYLDVSKAYPKDIKRCIDSHLTRRFGT
jgi:hypothetical protein